MIYNSTVRKRFWLMLIFLVLMFSIIVSNAYKYLPTQKTSIKTEANTQNLNEQTREIDVPETTPDDVVDESKTSDEYDIEDYVNSEEYKERQMKREKALEKIKSTIQIPDLFQEIEPIGANNQIAKDFPVLKEEPKSVKKVINEDIFAKAKMFKANE